MLRRKIIGIGALCVSAAAAIFRDMLSSAVGKVADAIFKENFVKSLGSFVTFTLTDVIVVLAAVFGLVALFWPKISKLLQSEIERRSLRSSGSGRRVFVECVFEEESELSSSCRDSREVLVDCTIRVNRLGLVDCVWYDGYRVESQHVTICTHEELQDVSRFVPLLEKAQIINTAIYVNHLFATQATVSDLWGGGRPASIKPLVVDELKPHPLRERVQRWFAEKLAI